MLSGVLLCAVLSAGCDEKCVNGYKIQKEYSTIFYHESWHVTEKDDLLDGAIRTSTYSFKDARALTVRCFQGAASNNNFKQYDLRYSIEVPLVARLVPELEKSGPIEFVVNIDGTPAATTPARAIAQKESVDFLATIEPTLIDRFSEAKKNIVVMPRQKSAHLDDVIEFGVAGLSANLVKVKEACASLHDQPTQPSETADPKPVKETK